MIHFYVWLLADYKLNSSFSTVAIVSFLERICDPAGLDLEPMLYQVIRKGTIGGARLSLHAPDNIQYCLQAENNTQIPTHPNRPRRR